MSLNKVRGIQRLFGALALASSVLPGLDAMGLLPAYGQVNCTTYANGCVLSVVVPCSNATCASMMGYPSSVQCDLSDGPTCDDGSAPVRFTATSATAWTVCVQSTNGQGGVCNNTCQVCANVYLYKLSSCSIASRCSTTTTILKCGKGGTPGC